jgi:putative methyltransferase (TIGR04325 family)
MPEEHSGDGDDGNKSNYLHAPRQTP